VFTHLNLTNFKIWRSTSTPEQPRLDLAPITLLLGTNSSGKSSLIQSLLLIRQTVTSGDETLDLNLGNPDDGDTLTLGNFDDVRSRGAERQPMVIEFGWREEATSANGLFNAHYQKGPDGQASLVRLTVQQDAESGFVASLGRRGGYSLNIHGQRNARPARIEHKPLQSFRLSEALLANLGRNGSIGNRLRPVALAVQDELARIRYLGPVRATPQRSYSWNGKLLAALGDDGAHAAQALIASWHAGELARKRKEPTPPQAALFTQAGAWLRRLGLAGGLRINELGGGRYELRVLDLLDATGSSNLRDVGAGVTQVLPVVTLILAAPAGTVVIVEEPESHLHPLAQSELAELFAEVQRRGVQLIVETHSEHLFRRMQTIMAREQIAAKDCALYFIDRDQTGPNIKRLQADQVGRIKNWPDKFFGDALGEARQQTKLAFEAQKRGKQPE
jgi:energy-coupling factor transporter ATP-binding protein EcfA2